MTEKELLTHRDTMRNFIHNSDLKNLTFFEKPIHKSPFTPEYTYLQEGPSAATELYPRWSGFLNTQRLEKIFPFLNIRFTDQNEILNNELKKRYTDTVHMQVSAVIGAVQDVERFEQVHIGKRIKTQNELGETQATIAYTTLAGRGARNILRQVTDPVLKIPEFLKKNFAGGMRGSTKVKKVYKQLRDYDLNIDINTPVPAAFQDKIADAIAKRIADIPYEDTVDTSELFNKPLQFGNGTVTLEKFSLNKEITIVKSTHDLDGKALVSYLILTDPTASIAHDFRHGPGQGNRQRELFYFGVEDSVRQKNDRVKPLVYSSDILIEEKFHNNNTQAYIEKPHYNSIIEWANALTRLGLPEFFMSDKTNINYSLYSENYRIYSQKFNTKNIALMKKELKRLIAEKRYGEDEWHEPEVLAQIFTALFYDYENAVSLFSDAGLFGDLLFPELGQRVNKTGRGVSAQILSGEFGPDSKKSYYIPDIGKPEQYGPWRLADQIQTLIRKRRFSRNGLALLVNEWEKQVSVKSRSLKKK